LGQALGSRRGNFITVKITNHARERADARQVSFTLSA
jgi:hypothetical protein